MSIKTEEIGRVAIRAYQTSNEGESHFDLMVGVNSEPSIPGGILVEQVLARDIVVTEQQNTDVRHDVTKTVVASKGIQYDQVEKAAKGRMSTSTGQMNVQPGTSTSKPAIPTEGAKDGVKDKTDYLKNMHDQLDNRVMGEKASQTATDNDLHAADKKLHFLGGLAVALSIVGVILGIVAIALIK
jgi:hypothetical protein